MSGLGDLVGRAYGPVAFRPTEERVAAYVAATGDDPQRWTHHAPPSFAGAVLFAVAPLFLGSPEVAPHTGVLIHVDQRFAWRSPLGVDAPCRVDAHVAKVRERGDMAFVTFEVTASIAGGVVIECTSTFLMGDEAPAPAGDEEEPPWWERAGEARPPGGGRGKDAAVRSASRADLVRYAAASGDFNPIHWDHGAARAAGLDGVVVHGLLIHAWVTQLLAADTGRPDPVAELKLRFRNALRPAQAASLEVRAIVDEPGRRSFSVRRGDEELVVGSALVRGP